MMLLPHLAWNQMKTSYHHRMLPPLLLQVSSILLGSIAKVNSRYRWAHRASEQCKFSGLYSICCSNWVLEYSVHWIDKDPTLSWMYHTDAKLKFKGQRPLKSFMISLGAMLRLLWSANSVNLMAPSSMLFSWGKTLVYVTNGMLQPLCVMVSLYLLRSTCESWTSSVHYKLHLSYKTHATAKATYTYALTKGWVWWWRRGDLVSVRALSVEMPKPEAMLMKPKNAYRTPLNLRQIDPQWHVVFKGISPGIYPTLTCLKSVHMCNFAKCINTYIL